MLHARFDELKAVHNIGQAEFARQFKVPGGPSMVSQHIKGRRPINLEAATAYAKGFNVSLAEISPRLALGVQVASSALVASPDSKKEGPDHINAGQNDTHKVLSLPDTFFDKSDVVIPQYGTGGAMGNGLVLQEQPGIIKEWRVSDEWLRLNVPHYTSKRNLAIVTGFGPSMKPMFNPGDPLLVDTGVKVIDHEGVYFFRVGDEGFIKIVQRVPEFDGPGHVLRIISKNEDYKPYDISPKNPHFEVLGKVLTVWRSEQH